LRQRLAENDLKPWRKDMWCIPHGDGEFVARMEEVLDYRRNGTANLFVFLDVHRPWRKVKVTDCRATVDLRELTDVHFPKSERIRVVLDNLSTRSVGALYHPSAGGLRSAEILCLTVAHEL
jgi:hypothetical protein